MTHPIYLDHNSTTALDARVLEQMLPWMTTRFGNPGSRHSLGRGALDAIEHARSQVANAVGVQAAQVVFTASGTEANNFAIKGMAANLEPSQLLVSSIEHPCILQPALAIRQYGWTVDHIQVNDNGLLSMPHLESLLQIKTGIVSIMLANNETGAIQPINEVSSLVRRRKAYLHTDAVQALGKIPVDFHALGVHAMTLSSHKIGGPLGAGALVLDKRLDMHPLLHGGGQERGLRSGTENVAAIVGFGAACELATANLSAKATHTNRLRQHLEAKLKELDAVVFAQTVERIPNTSFFAFEGVDGETLVTALDKLGFSVASGSACSSYSTEPSHVLLAMGIDNDTAQGAVRVSVGADNSLTDIEGFLISLKQALSQLKSMPAIAA